MVVVVQLLFKDLSASMFVPVLPDGSSVCSSCCTQDIGKGRIEHLPATRRIGKRETARRDLSIFSVDRRRLASYHNRHAPTTVRADRRMLGLEGEYVPTGVNRKSVV